MYLFLSLSLSLLSVCVYMCVSHTYTHTHLCLYCLVVGCSDPPIPRGGWAKRLSDNVVTFGCKDRPQHELWRLECELNHWKGRVGNCTSAGGLQLATTAALKCSVR